MVVRCKQPGCTKQPSYGLEDKKPTRCVDHIQDGLIDCLTHSVIIEIDEEQHAGYETLCDNRRTMELFEDLGSRPIIFVRLNPDKYSHNSKTTKGCFMTTKQGELKVVKTEFSRRFNLLQEVVETAMTDGAPARELSYVKLFYSD